MAQARRRDAWDHTARIAATLINLSPHRKGLMIKAADLNPYRQDDRPPPKPAAPPAKLPLSILFGLFQKPC